MTALDGALAQLDRVGDESDPTPERAEEPPDLDGLADPVELPGGRCICPAAARSTDRRSHVSAARDGGAARSTSAAL
jgi:hypothetical protein